MKYIYKIPESNINMQINLNKLFSYKYNSNKQYKKKELETVAKQMNHWNKIATKYGEKPLKEDILKFSKKF